jgi:hypothetical protein
MFLFLPPEIRFSYEGASMCFSFHHLKCESVKNVPSCTSLFNTCHMNQPRTRLLVFYHLKYESAKKVPPCVSLFTT